MTWLGCKPKSIGQVLRPRSTIAQGNLHDDTMATCMTTPWQPPRIHTRQPRLLGQDRIVHVNSRSVGLAADVAGLGYQQGGAREFTGTQLNYPSQPQQVTARRIASPRASWPSACSANAIFIACHPHLNVRSPWKPPRVLSTDENATPDCSKHQLLLPHASWLH